ncbi:HAMP domain-containing sensor histidine kinase [Bacillus horti]|uniref:histidine kinase n=1 Tax=Caldalkalibacillus horti TaxID=77523 RepID=A0ABT9VT01_9BACI|nr:HAMP domain-containing sensor histidine kinase [Bacillus horti]MDQ0164103.1 two-component system sensor histidine kinase CssS [Bacillus horti]
MKNKPLALQIWLVFTSISFGLVIVLALLLLLTLRSFFTDEIFHTIEDVQRSVWSNEIVRQESPFELIQTQQNQRMVNHIIFLQDGSILTPNQIPQPFLQKIYSQAVEQQGIEQRYTIDIEDNRLLYVVRRGQLGFQPAYLVSYMYDTYRNDLVLTLFKQISYVLLLVLLLSWLPAILLARYLSKPIVQMEKHVKSIANRDWQTKLIVEREDEIGHLAQSIEKMREQLIKQDETQQSMLQHISHELKTPVMVIQSYTQSIQDGIYPNGSLNDTLGVIQQESSRLEKLVHNLLYLTKLDYLSTQPQIKVELDLSQLLEDTIDRLKWQKPELSWDIQLEPCVTWGVAEQWKVAFENLLDNQMRYAATRIFVEVEHVQGGLAIRIGNDGSPIEEATIKDLFQLYEKGQGGKYGLGLAIVQKILTLHDANISVRNLSSGVSFDIFIPNHEKSF